MKKSLIALSVLAATSAFAGGTVTGGVLVPTATGLTVPVAVNHDGLGDLLIAPVYMANGGWQTEIKVVNTSRTYSTAAKVVINDRFTSGELIDFLIFLSPGDVWNGTLAYTCATPGAGCTPNILTMTSKDVDSTPQLPFKVVNGQVDPTTIELKRVGPNGAFITGGDIGYVNIVESAAWSLGQAVVPKPTIVAQHNTDLAAAVSLGCLAVNGNQGQIYTVLTATNTTPSLAASQAQLGANCRYNEVRTSTVASTENILAGTVRLENTINRNVSTLPMVAIQNYRNANPLTPAVYTGIGTDDPVNGSPSYTTVGALEWVLNKNNWVLPYDHAISTFANIASVTFPTRQTYDALSHGGNTNASPGIYQFRNASGGAAFTQGAVTVRDQQEVIQTNTQQVSPIPASAKLNFAEGSFLTIQPSCGIVPSNDGTGFMNVVGTGPQVSPGGVCSNVFRNGWVELNIDRQTGVPTAFGGAPAVVTQLQLSILSGADGNPIGLRSEWWYPQAKAVAGVSSND